MRRYAVLVANAVLLPGVLSLAFALTTGSVRAQEEASISVEPASQTVSIDDESFEVQILVDDVTGETGLGGYTLVIAYDSEVVNGLTITDSGYVGSTGNEPICPSSAIDDEAGRLAHLCFTIPIIPQPGPRTSEPELLVTVAFEPVGAGTTTLDITETTLLEPEGDELDVSHTNGEVTVVSGTPPAAGQQIASPTAQAEAEDGGGDGNLGVYLAAGIGAGAVVVVLVGVTAYLSRRRAAGG